MERAGLKIELSDAGVKRVVVDYPQGRPAEGFELLTRALPALQELDRKAREGERAGG